jgi:hypothetical protein
MLVSGSDFESGGRRMDKVVEGSPISDCACWDGPRAILTAGDAVEPSKFPCGRPRKAKLASVAEE